MIESVELTLKLKVNWRDKPIEAVVVVQPGDAMYFDAGELAALEEQLGLPVESIDGQCFKLCLSELFNHDSFESIREVMLMKIRDIEDVSRKL